VSSADETPGVGRETLANRIRDALVRRITSGGIEPGTRLVETAIAADYGTSQAPVREALRALEAMRMVEVRPRRGTFVRPFIQQTLRESYVVRAALEETATRLAILSGSLPLDALHADIDAMRAAAESDDADASSAASVAFHRHIVEAAHNGLLLHSWEALQIGIRTSATIVAADLDLGVIADEHQELLVVLERGDLEEACEHARDHQWHYADLPHDARGRAKDSPAGRVG
jgi:DNA-binding GntR family transcriptional regulator